jgi:hypothetical protein
MDAFINIIIMADPAFASLSIPSMDCFIFYNEGSFSGCEWLHPLWGARGVVVRCQPVSPVATNILPAEAG